MTRIVTSSREDILKATMVVKSLAAAAILAGAATLSGAAIAQEGGRAAAVNSPIGRVIGLRAEHDGDDRVFGGKEAAPGAYPFQVALLASSVLDDNPDSQFDAQFCGGSLIAPGWVLTAAHCLVDGGAPIDADAVTILTGATSLREGVRHAVAEVVVHPDYSETTLDNDIGLLRLVDESDSPSVRMTDADIEVGAARVTGWGRMDNGAFPINLMEADLELTANAACNAGIKEIYARDLGLVLRYYAGRMRYSAEGVSAAIAAASATMGDPLTGNMLCAGIEDGARDACNGDSGGPLFTTEGGEPVQVGIVSWGEGPMDEEAACGHANAYGVYTRLANYRDWIADKTGE